MQTLIIDGQDLYGQKDLHDYLAKALDFPSYYGATLLVYKSCAFSSA